MRFIAFVTTVVLAVGISACTATEGPAGTTTTTAARALATTDGVVTRVEWRDALVAGVGHDRAQECADNYKSTEDAQTCRDQMESICQHATETPKQSKKYARDNGDGTQTLTVEDRTTVRCDNDTLLAWGPRSDENRWLVGTYYGTKGFAGLFRKDGRAGGYSRTTTKRPHPPRPPAPVYTPAPVAGGSSTYTGPRCYAPGGKTWTPC